MTVALLAVALGQRMPDPAVAAASRELVMERSDAALAALAELEAEVAAALDVARSASARVLTGETSPTDQIQEAARLALTAEERVVAARRAISALAAAESARNPAGRLLPQPVEAGELASAAGQLRSSVDEVEAFVVVRQRASDVPAMLERVLTALADGTPEAAREFVGTARADHAAVVAWESDLPTLPVWIETTDAMIGAVEAMVNAVDAGDSAAASRAADAFAALGDDGAQADRALRIALGEGGSALLAAPLSRLATVLEAIGETRSVIQDLVVSPP
ncbi:MAG: hypothetical protein ACR2K4_02370 [Candidatus Limnocylindria bacterium]